MKRVLFFAFLFLFFAANSFAQNTTSMESSGQQTKFFGECDPDFQFILGYVPKSSVNALKTTFDFNNIFFKRAGVYTSLEKGLDSDYFTNIYGLTLSVHQKVYLFGGVDLFTKYGLFTSDEGVRKEFGIGYNPWKKLVLNLGWSGSVGITFGAGIKIPL
jgi:hypothetical protein